MQRSSDMGSSTVLTSMVPRVILRGVSSWRPPSGFRCASTFEKPRKCRHPVTVHWVNASTVYRPCPHFVKMASQDGFEWIEDIKREGEVYPTISPSVLEPPAMHHAPPQAVWDSAPPQAVWDSAPPQAVWDPTPPQTGWDPTPPQAGWDPTPPQAVSNPAPAQAALKDTMMASAYLLSGQSLVSNDGSHKLWVQPDGNLVVYNIATNRAIWATGTVCSSLRQLCILEDGNLVAYDAKENVIWASYSRTKGSPPQRLVMQNDGNLVLYDQKGAPLWASNTVGC